MPLALRSLLPAPRSLLLTALCSLLFASGPLHAQTVLQTYTLTEYFGVSHPDQILEFDAPDGLNTNNAYLTGPDGTEVAYQLLSDGKLAIRTDLPANTSKTWTLKAGKAPTASTPNPVTISEKADYFEIQNGLTGVRVFRPNGQTRTIPIQSLGVTNGTAYIITAADHGLETACTNSPDFATGPLPVTLSGLTKNTGLNGKAFSVQVRDDYWKPDPRRLAITGLSVPNGTDSSGTLVVADTRRAPIQGVRLADGRWTASAPILTTFNNYGPFSALSLNSKTVSAEVLESGPLKVVVRLRYSYDRPTLVYSIPLIPAGAGYYQATLTMEAGQNCILIEDETDMDFSYLVDCYPELQPDQGRYRGHHSTSVANGREADGRQYRQWHDRPAMDAFRDFDFSQTVSLGIPLWDPWCYDTGWYWMLYNQAAGASAPVIGAYARNAGRGLGCDNPSVQMILQPASGSAGRVAGFGFRSVRGNYTWNVDPVVRVPWAIFVGTKGNDLGDPYQCQNIARQMNLQGGISLDKVKDYYLSFADPAGGYGRLFMEPQILRTTVSRLQSEQPPQNDVGLYGYLRNAEPTARPLIDMWANLTGSTNQLNAANLRTTAGGILNAYVNGDGIYDFQYHYWMGGVVMNRQLAMIDSLLADSRTSASNRAVAKAAGSLFANLLWDDDLVPIGNWASNRVNLGTANMPIQMRQYRDAYALALPDHPTMVPKVAYSREDILGSLRSIINDAGAEMGSPHYAGASVEPTLASCLQLRMNGEDVFASEPKLARFAEFYINLLTPAEVRFGGSRKLISLGDGSTESTEIPGILATGLRTADPVLSSRLMGAWNQGGKRHSGFFITTLLMIDEQAPATDPALGNATFPGYMSVLRNAWGTPNETAAWFVNGDFYSDHRHADRGNLVIYALGSPLSLDWGSMYSPQVPGAFQHSVVLPESAIGNAWNQDAPPLNAGDFWKSSTQEVFLAFSSAAVSQGSFTSAPGTLWTRQVASLHTDDNYPMLYIRDRLSGTNATALAVFTLNLAAQGPVATPAGNVTPPLRSWWSNNQLPSATTPFTLPAGPQRLGFTGQWLIDWDLYVLGDGTQQALLGNWAHNWHPSTEQSEFQAANKRAFEERQHILRLRGSQGFDVLILPYRKGTRRSDQVVVQDAGSTAVRTSSETNRIGANFWSCQSAARQSFAVFDTQPAVADGFSVSGGPCEIVIENQTVTITAHGPKGQRRLKMPIQWQPASAPTDPGTLSWAPDEWVLDYQSTEPVTVRVK